MDIKKLQTFDALTPTQPQKPSGVNPSSGEAFKSALADVMGAGANAPIAGVQKSSVGGLGSAGVKFSNHAIDRMQSRGIYYSPEDIAKINDAVKRAAAKGSKDSLLLMKDSALIVSVKNNTVVTVMDQSALKENVFTNIDSTIVM